MKARIAKTARATTAAMTPAIALGASTTFLVPPPPPAAPSEVVLGVGVLLNPGELLDPVVLNPVGALTPVGLVDPAGVDSGKSVQWSEAFLDNRPAGYTY